MVKNGKFLLKKEKKTSKRQSLLADCWWYLDQKIPPKVIHKLSYENLTNIFKIPRYRERKFLSMTTPSIGIEMHHRQYKAVLLSLIMLTILAPIRHEVCQGILKGVVLLYHWPPVWLVWNQLYDNWQFLFLFAKPTNPNQSNRRSMVQWYFPL